MERIIQDELLARTRDQLNEHQHGFLANKSCTTNLISLSDSINTYAYLGLFQTI